MILKDYFPYEVVNLMGVCNIDYDEINEELKMPTPKGLINSAYLVDRDFADVSFLREEDNAEFEKGEFTRNTKILASALEIWLDANDADLISEPFIASYLYDRDCEFEEMFGIDKSKYKTVKDLCSDLLDWRCLLVNFYHNLETTVKNLD